LSWGNYDAHWLPGDTNALWIILGTAAPLLLLISAEDFFPSVSPSNQYDRHICTKHAKLCVFWPATFPTDRPVHHVAHTVAVSYAALWGLKLGHSNETYNLVSVRPSLPAMFQLTKSINF
jgi:hypothetical protein